MFNLKLINLFLPEITKSFLDYKDVVVDNDDISREGSPHHVARMMMMMMMLMMVMMMIMMMVRGSHGRAPLIM